MLGLSPSHFGTIRLARAGIRTRRNPIFRKRPLFVAGVSPPAIFVLRQIAHLGALLSAVHMFAVAVAQRRLRARNQGWRLAGEGSGRYRSQKNHRPKGFIDCACVGPRFHESFWNANIFQTIARRMGFAGSRVVGVLVPLLRLRMLIVFRARII
jgi:hypothetical protein